MNKPDSLRVVLSVRLRAEQAEERALATASAEVQRAEAAMNALEAEQKHIEAEGLGETGGLLHGSDLHAREQRLHSLRSACDAAHALLLRSMNDQARQQAIYLDARRNREVLEAMLKQRKRTEQAQQQRRESSVADDLFLSRLAVAKADPLRPV